jgi:hypothetical protein
MCSHRSSAHSSSLPISNAPSTNTLALLVIISMMLGVLVEANTVEALPYLRFPWPAGHEHRINGGWTYGCPEDPWDGTHDETTATGSTAYDASYYAIDFQFGDEADGSPLDVAATAPGTVVFMADDNDGYGNKVVLDHGGGYYSVYAHFRAVNPWGPGISVSPPTSVFRGQVVGYAGGTGGNYEVHLHFHMQSGLSAYKLEPMLTANPPNTTFGYYGGSVENSGACASEPNDPSDYWISCPTGDGDCDGFPSSVGVTNWAPETYIGTNASVPCAATATANDEAQPDVWPFDFNDSRTVSGPDVGKFSPAYGHLVSDGPFGSPPLPGERFDWNEDGGINGSDVGKFSAYYGKSCA